MPLIERVWSGGQTGVDQGAWRAAQSVGLPTGGSMPLGYRTEGVILPSGGVGPDESHPEFAGLYGAREMPTRDYTERRRANVRGCDVMILIGDKTSRGSIGLLRDWTAIQKHRQWLWVQPGVSTPRMAARFLVLMSEHENWPRTLLVAGNRESVAPGIGDKADRFLVSTFRMMLDPRFNRE